MNRRTIAVIFPLLVMCLCWGLDSNSAAQQNSPNSQTATSPTAMQTQPAEANPQNSSASNATGQREVIPVELTRSLDSRKLKTGDTVEARTVGELRTGDGTVIPRGSKIQGHVTQATARAKGDAQSTLGIQFDKIVLKNGNQFPARAVIQAVAAPVITPAPMPAGESAPTPLGGSPGPMSGGTSPMGRSTPSSNLPNSPYPGTQGPAQPRYPQSTAPLTPQSTGVVGLPDLELGQNSVLTSKAKNVRLDSGTQLLLRVQSQ